MEDSAESEVNEDSTFPAGIQGNCLETVHWLYNFLDGELTDDRRSQISQHLDDCTPCLKAFGFEKDLRQMIADRCRDVPPPGLRERIAAALRQAASDGSGGSETYE